MFVEQIRCAVEAAPRNDLPRLSAIVWKSYASGAIGEGETQALSEMIEARKALPPSPKVTTSRRVGSKPRSAASLERRRRWVASGRMPPAIAGNFTMGEGAVLAVVAAQVAKHGDCRLTIGAIAALAGVCPSTVRNAMAAARRLDLVTITERRISAFRNDTNIITIVSVEWRAWLRIGGGYKSVKPTHTDSYLLASKRPPSAPKKPSDLSWTGKTTPPHWHRPPKRETRSQ